MMSELLIIEPFYGGSHKQMIDLLQSRIQCCDVITMPAKKWHWRARTSALYLSQQIPYNDFYRTLFASSVLNLAELLALRPELNKLHKIFYFHENQLIYPVKKQQERDFQYGYNQILSCMVADKVVFNSKYNMESFLTSIKSFLKLIPDHRPKDLEDIIRPKCQVLYFPLDLPCKANEQIRNVNTESVLVPCPTSEEKVCVDNSAVPEEIAEGIKSKEEPLHIVWAHRWEHDKDPETFFEAMFELSEYGCNFSLSVLGEQFTDIPEIFEVAKHRLERHIIHWGYQESKTDYIEIIKSADVVVSTALHEFFGVSMLEAVYYGCYPLCPNRLVYPEIFQDVYLYNTKKQLVKTLKRFCKFPSLARKHICQVDVNKYLWTNLAEMYLDLLNVKDKDNVAGNTKDVT